jgi:hypothetical protein
MTSTGPPIWFEMTEQSRLTCLVVFGPVIFEKSVANVIS